MALSSWASKVKKPEDEKACKEGSPGKVLCTAYEKSLKKMEGDLTFVKEICF